MSKRTRRSASELLAAAEEKMNKLRVRAAIDQAKANPSLASLISAISAQDDILRESSKLLGNGPQSCATSARSHLLWLDEINAKRDLAEISDTSAHAVKAKLQKELGAFTARIAEGKKVTTKEVNVRIETVRDENTSEDVNIANAHLEDARNARMNATQLKRQPKRRSANS